MYFGLTQLGTEISLDVGIQQIDEQTKHKILHIIDKFLTTTSIYLIFAQFSSLFVAVILGNFAEHKDWEVGSKELITYFSSGYQ